VSATILYPWTGDHLLAMIPRSGWTDKRLILMAHDRNGSSGDFLPLPGSIGNAAAYLADNGYAVAAVNMPPTSWGNIDAVQALSDAYSFIHDFGVYPLKYGFVGFGTGGTAVLNFILNQAYSVVAGAYLWSPVTDLYWAHLQDPDWQNEIDDAYGDFPNDADGFTIAGNIQDFRDIDITLPITLAHPTDDPVVPYQLSTSFVAAVDRPDVQMRTPDFTGGHDSYVTAVTGPELLEFFETQANWSPV
jgi:alpha-beta hydrolase superfamily lysophospholipase